MNKIEKERRIAICKSSIREADAFGMGIYPLLLLAFAFQLLFFIQAVQTTGMDAKQTTSMISILTISPVFLAALMSIASILIRSVWKAKMKSLKAGEDVEVYLND